LHRASRKGGKSSATTIRSGSIGQGRDIKASMLLIKRRTS
jgi:hypothetical protein